MLFVVRKELPFALEHKLETDSTRLEQPRPMSTRLSYPFSLHDLLAFGTEGPVAAWALILPCCIHIQVSYPFFFLFSIWPHPLRKDEAKTQRSQPGTLVIGSLSQTPAIQQSQALKGHSSLPPPITTSLFSQQGIAFPVLTLVLAHSMRFSLPPAASCFAWVLGSLR